MKIIAFGLLFFSFNALACWKMQGSIAVNNDKVEINQKIDHDKIYSFASGKHLFHVKIPSQVKNKTDTHSIEIGIQKKDGITLSEVSKGQIIVKLGKEATMTKQDIDTGEITTFIMKITEI
ncbi:MAG: hypothetical protein H0V66_08430 [Bdellovibrionales bacterium]|nr:hypothetical protein [Bdellovibrionales bacterium]